MLATVFGVLLYVTFAIAAIINSEDKCSDYQLVCPENETCISLNSKCTSANREPGEECTIWTSEVREVRCPKGKCDSSVSDLCEDITTCDTVQPKLVNINDTTFESCQSPAPIPNMIMTPSLPSGKQYDYLFFEYKCLPEYVMVGDKYQFCSNGKWCGRTPKCVRISSGTTEKSPLSWLTSSILIGPTTSFRSFSPSMSAIRMAPVRTPTVYTPPAPRPIPPAGPRPIQHPSFRPLLIVPGRPVPTGAGKAPPFVPMGPVPAGAGKAPLFVPMGPVPAGAGKAPPFVPMGPVPAGAGKAPPFVPMGPVPAGAGKAPPFVPMGPVPAGAGKAPPFVPMGPVPAGAGKAPPFVPMGPVPAGAGKAPPFVPMGPVPAGAGKAPPFVPMGPVPARAGKAPPFVPMGPVPAGAGKAPPFVPMGPVPAGAGKAPPFVPMGPVPAGAGKAPLFVPMGPVPAGAGKAPPFVPMGPVPAGAGKAPPFVPMGPVPAGAGKAPPFVPMGPVPAGAGKAPPFVPMGPVPARAGKAPPFVPMGPVPAGAGKAPLFVPMGPVPAGAGKAPPFVPMGPVPAGAGKAPLFVPMGPVPAGAGKAPPFVPMGPVPAGAGKAPPFVPMGPVPARAGKAPPFVPMGPVPAGAGKAPPFVPMGPVPAGAGKAPPFVPMGPVPAGAGKAPPFVPMGPVPAGAGEAPPFVPGRPVPTGPGKPPQLRSRGPTSGAAPRPVPGKPLNNNLRGPRIRPKVSQEQSPKETTNTDQKISKIEPTAGQNTRNSGNTGNSETVPKVVAKVEEINHKQKSSGMESLNQKSPNSETLSSNQMFTKLEEESTKQKPSTSKSEFTNQIQPEGISRVIDKILATNGKEKPATSGAESTDKMSDGSKTSKAESPKQKWTETLMKAIGKIVKSDAKQKQTSAKSEMSDKSDKSSDTDSNTDKEKKQSESESSKKSTTILSSASSGGSSISISHNINTGQSLSSGKSPGTTQPLRHYWVAASTFEGPINSSFNPVLQTNTRLRLSPEKVTPQIHTAMNNTLLIGQHKFDSNKPYHRSIRTTFGSPFNPEIPQSYGPPISFGINNQLPNDYINRPVNTLGLNNHHNIYIGRRYGYPMPGNAPSTFDPSRYMLNNGDSVPFPFKSAIQRPPLPPVPNPLVSNNFNTPLPNNGHLIPPPYGTIGHNNMYINREIPEFPTARRHIMLGNGLNLPSPLNAVRHMSNNGDIMPLKFDSERHMSRIQPPLNPNFDMSINDDRVSSIVDSIGQNPNYGHKMHLPFDHEIDSPDNPGMDSPNSPEIDDNLPPAFGPERHMPIGDSIEQIPNYGHKMHLPFDPKIDSPDNPGMDSPNSPEIDDNLPPAAFGPERHMPIGVGNLHNRFGPNRYPPHNNPISPPFDPERSQLKVDNINLKDQMLPNYEDIGPESHMPEHIFTSNSSSSQEFLNDGTVLSSRKSSSFYSNTFSASPSFPNSYPGQTLKTASKKIFMPPGEYSDAAHMRTDSNSLRLSKVSPPEIEIQPMPPRSIRKRRKSGSGVNRSRTRPRKSVASHRRTGSRTRIEPRKRTMPDLRANSRNLPTGTRRLPPRKPLTNDDRIPPPDRSLSNSDSSKPTKKDNRLLPRMSDEVGDIPPPPRRTLSKDDSLPPSRKASETNSDSLQPPRYTDENDDIPPPPRSSLSKDDSLPPSRRTSANSDSLQPHRNTDEDDDIPPSPRRSLSKDDSLPPSRKTSANSDSLQPHRNTDEDDDIPPSPRRSLSKDDSLPPSRKTSANSDSLQPHRNTDEDDDIPPSPRRSLSKDDSLPPSRKTSANSDSLQPHRNTDEDDDIAPSPRRSLSKDDSLPPSRKTSANSDSLQPSLKNDPKQSSSTISVDKESHLASSKQIPSVEFDGAHTQSISNRPEPNEPQQREIQQSQSQKGTNPSKEVTITLQKVLGTVSSKSQKQDRSEIDSNKVATQSVLGSAFSLLQKLPELIPKILEAMKESDNIQKAAIDSVNQKSITSSVDSAKNDPPTSAVENTNRSPSSSENYLNHKKLTTMSESKHQNPSILNIDSNQNPLNSDYTKQKQPTSDAKSANQKHETQSNQKAAGSETKSTNERPKIKEESGEDLKSSKSDTSKKKSKKQENTNSNSDSSKSSSTDIGQPLSGGDAGGGSIKGGADSAPLEYICRANEWTCNDGTCVNETNKCDGYIDCPDSSDEWECSINASCTLPPYPDRGIYTRRLDANTTVPASPLEEFDTVLLHINCDDGYDATIKDIICINGIWMNEMPKCENLDTIKRLPNNSANWCTSTQWRCKDGGCIDNKERCDGKNDCYDRSDELYCTVKDKNSYSNCVVPDHPPNGMYTFNPPYEPGREVVFVNVSVECDDDFRADKESVSCSDGEWSGKKPECIQLVSTANCSEGQWQCINGECISMTSKCDGHYDCIDHTDEAEELCSKNDANLNQSPCSVPFINNGQYTINDYPKIQPREGLVPKFLNVTCDAGHMLQGMPLTLCSKGIWVTPIPKCTRYCLLKQHPSMQYQCRVMENDIIGFRPCREKEPIGTVIKLSCSTHYFSEEFLPDIKCTEFGWSYGQTCKAECGTLTPHAKKLSIGGQVANRSDVPWHAGIYQKKRDKINNITHYEQICGGTLISYSIVLSAAHCFHGNDNNITIRKSRRQFAVGIGKLYRLWDDPSEIPEDVQKSDVKRIIIPESYHSESTFYQSDIALIEVKTPFEHRAHIVPVCVDLDAEFDERHISGGGFGKVAGWGYMNEYGESSPVLKILDEPIFNHSQCFEKVPIQSRPLITSDKICGGYTDGTQALCGGDSGGGLSMPEIRQGIERYYLRGIVSTSTPSSSSAKTCNKYSLTYFTRVVHHTGLISQWWSPI